MTGARLLAGPRMVVLAALLSLPLAAQQAPPWYRVVESATGATVGVEQLVTRLVAADVAFFGEQHDDEATHRLQRMLFEQVGERRGNVSLALEMFERDVQEPLDHFQMGHTSEAEFLAGARPWPRYARDYKPLVDLAVTREWAVIAANVPRTIAAEVAQSGLGVLADRPAADRALFAADLRCEPAGAYFDRFVDALGTHGQTLGDADRVRYYESQCLKDETMAESIAQAHAAGSMGGGQPLVISVNGIVHVDFRLGTVERVARRLPAATIVTVTMVPVARLDEAVPAADVLARADFVVFVQSP